MTSAAPPRRTLRSLLRSLYHGQSLTAVRFRTAWIAVDIVIIAFFIAAPLIRETPFFMTVDYAIAALLWTWRRGRRPIRTA